jgi:hypothetical protein
MELIKKLDHPLLFLLFLMLALKGFEALLTWGFKSLGWAGPAALIQHP